MGIKAPKREGRKLRDNRQILAMSWLLALFAADFVACSSPAAEPDETETTAAEPASASPPGTIPSAKAGEYINDKGTVCGPVVNTRNDDINTNLMSYYADFAEIQLDFDQPYPKQSLVVVIHPDDEKNFAVDPVEFYKDKEVCATGTINSTFGTVYMRVFEQSDLEVMP